MSKIWNTYQVVKEKKLSFTAIRWIDINPNTYCKIFLNNTSGTLNISDYFIDLLYGEVHLGDTVINFKKYGEGYQLNGTYVVWSDLGCGVTENVLFYSDMVDGVEVPIYVNGLKGVEPNWKKPLTIYDSTRYKEQKEVIYPNDSPNDKVLTGELCDPIIVAETDCRCAMEYQAIEDGTICDYVNKHKRLRHQYKDGCDGSWKDFNPQLYTIGELIETDSEECGTVEYREEVSGTTCYGYDKYEAKVPYIRKKGGEWEKLDCEGLIVRGNLIKKNSFECGYYTTSSITTEYKDVCGKDAATYGYTSTTLSQTSKYTLRKTQRKRTAPYPTNTDDMEESEWVWIDDTSSKPSWTTSRTEYNSCDCGYYTTQWEQTDIYDCGINIDSLTGTTDVPPIVEPTYEYSSKTETDCDGTTLVTYNVSLKREVGTTQWTTVSRTETNRQANSVDCGYVAPPVEPTYEYQTVESATCEGYTKIVYTINQRREVGTTQWETTSSSVQSRTENSTDCGYVEPIIPDEGDVPPNNQIWYTTYNGTTTTPYSAASIGTLQTNTYTNGKGVMTFASDVTSIGDRAFRSNTAITTIDLPNSVTIIGTSAFTGNRRLTNINIPSGVTEIGNDAFYNCSGLTSVTFEESSQLSIIKTDAFENCFKLTNIHIPNSVLRLGQYSFGYCSGLTSVTFEESSQLTTIDINAFVRCTSLINIAIPSGVTYIGGYAFSNCTSLTSVSIPNSTSYIGGYAFGDCSILTSITYNGTSTEFKAINKQSGWKSYVPSTCIVHCTDGDFAISRF